VIGSLLEVPNGSRSFDTFEMTLSEAGFLSVDADFGVNFFAMTGTLLFVGLFATRDPTVRWSR